MIHDSTSASDGEGHAGEDLPQETSEPGFDAASEEEAGTTSDNSESS